MAVIHRSSWVVPVSSPPIHDGAVLVDQGRVVAVDAFAAFAGQSEAVIDHGLGILMPGLVNGHAHLELSHCPTGVNENLGDMVGWIGELLTFREDYIGDDVDLIAQQCLAKMENSGIDLIADIGNDPSFARDGKDAEVLFFHELLGLSQVATEYMLEVLDSQKSSYTSHAPYSTSLTLLTRVKAQSTARGHIMPIHVAESSAEMEFLKTGQGDFQAFLDKRGFWDGSFVPPATSPVHYLHDAGLLDSKTLCVHCVHVDDHDLQLLQESGAGVCLCLGSNEYLGVGLPPVVAMLEAGLFPCLGTDSLASNPEVSIWREMNLIHRTYPTLTSQQIIEMATCNGAHALDRPGYGVLCKDAVSMIFVDYEGDSPLDFLSFDSSAKKITRCL